LAVEVEVELLEFLQAPEAALVVAPVLEDF
jgi:hypothetical protein